MASALRLVSSTNLKWFFVLYYDGAPTVLICLYMSHALCLGRFSLDYAHSAMAVRKFLVTGLCLQGNKGGPAIALSLMRVLRDHGLGDSEFCFAVPVNDMENEKLRATEYGVTVIPALHINLRSFPRFLRCIQCMLIWWKTARLSDAVIDMTAISYAGPPARPVRASIEDGRFFSFLLARLARRPFRAWTQSIGPFNSWLVKTLARIDLRTQPVVYCRGKSSMECARELIRVLHCLAGLAAIVCNTW
jgi:hypothetical protein